MAPRHSPSLRQLGRALLPVLVFVGLAARGFAAPAEPTIRLQVGLGGVFRVGTWTPVWVTLETPDSLAGLRLELIALDGDGQEVRYTAPPFELPANRPTVVERQLRFGRAKPELQVRLLDSGGRLLAETSSGALTRAVSSTTRLFVLAGDSLGADLALKQFRSTAPGVELHRLPADASWPTHWSGWESVDTLVITSASLPQLGELAPERFAALERWIEFGGRLVLCAGVQSERLFAGESSERTWRRLLPGKFAGRAAARQTLGLESFADAHVRIDLAADLPLATLSDVRGRVLAYEGLGGANDQPLIVRHTVGFGDVTFVAFDPDQPPLAEWRERPRLVAKLLFDVATGEDSAPSQTGRASHVGYRDLSGQLRAALDRFPGVSRVSFSLVVVLVALYVGLLGPGDYFFVRRVLKRPMAMWLTLPLLVGGFAATAYALVQRYHADRRIVNQVDIVDIDAERGLVRGTSWRHLYAPADERFDLTFAPTWPTTSGDALLTWHGLPGTGLGGLDVPRPQFLEDAQYELAAARDESGLRTKLSGLPLRIASTKSLSARWGGSAKVEPAGELRAAAFGLEGTLRNPLPVELTECQLVHENWIYRLESTLRPGESVAVREMKQQNLKWRLQRKSLVATSDVSTPWDEGELDDIPRLLEVMLLHGLAGGQAYTRLTHRFQAFLDQSEQVRAGRAILLARAAVPAAECQMAERREPLVAGQQWTIVRFVLPVEKARQP